MHFQVHRQDSRFSDSYPWINKESQFEDHRQHPIACPAESVFEFVFAGVMAKKIRVSGSGTVEEANG